MRHSCFRFENSIKALLLTFLTLTIIFTTYFRPVQSINTLTISPDTGPVETEIIISGTGASPFSQIKIYWESIDEERLIVTTTADSDGGFLAEEIEVLEGTAGKHWIIVVDDHTLNNGAQFTIIPQIKLKVVTKRTFNNEIETSFVPIKYNKIKFNLYSCNWFVL